MTEVLEYEEHMVQWRDLAIHSIHLELTNKINPQTPEEAREIMARMTQIQACSAGVNPFMRPGVVETDEFIPRAYNGFVLRVC
jgi:hypothetical protein